MGKLRKASLLVVSLFAPLLVSFAGCSCCYDCCNLEWAQKPPPPCSYDEHACRWDDDRYRWYNDGRYEKDYYGRAEQENLARCQCPEGEAR